jgi:hypothetical protein
MGDRGGEVGTKNASDGGAGGAERGGRYDVGELPRADLADLDDEASGKREGLGMTIGGGCGSVRLEGTLGRADNGAGLGDGRVRRESREERRAGRGRGDVRHGRWHVGDGMRCWLLA